MTIHCVWEHNGGDSLVYASDLPGAFTRGASGASALEKMKTEATAYLRWAGREIPADLSVSVIQETCSDLEIRDADSDVLFETEKGPLRQEEYEALKELALRSARDFLSLYQAVPDKRHCCLPARKTFYGQRPRTASEMYTHTKSVNSYYFGEIGVAADNHGTIAECRARGFSLLEQQPDYLENTVFPGSYGEKWNLHKVLRRFLWHDRIHAKAMYRMAVASFGPGSVPDPFRFEH